MAFWIVATTYIKVTKKRYDFLLLFLLFKSLLGLRRDLDVSPEVLITLRISNFVFCLWLGFVQSLYFCCLDFSNFFITKENKCKASHSLLESFERQVSHVLLSCVKWW